MLQLIHDNFDFLWKSIMSGEAYFHLNGYVNKQKIRLWGKGQNKPSKYSVKNSSLLCNEWTLLTRSLVFTTFRFWSSGIIDPLFFENNERTTVNVNGKCYRAMLIDWYVLKSKLKIWTTFGINRTALRTIQCISQSIFWV